MHQLLLESFQAAVAAADPLHITARHLPAPPRGRTVVVGAGKAAASMARAVEAAWPADAPLEGLVTMKLIPLSVVPNPDIWSAQM